MATLIYSSRALADLERLADFLAEHGSDVVDQTVDAISEAIAILAHHPLIGRRVEDGLRELVISRGNSGYIALYDYFAGDDVILIQAIRHQREAGYAE